MLLTVTGELQINTVAAVRVALAEQDAPAVPVEPAA
jgi:hypothetical protein